MRVGLGTITGTVHRAEAAGLDWPQIQALADDALEVVRAEYPTATARACKKVTCGVRSVSVGADRRYGCHASWR
ncbi:MAG: hypothetical protein RDU83_00430 [bacterium]|nr:hypothetical protein [bacterium]